MPPNRKIVKACKAMKPYGITQRDVKGVLKELLALYDNNWELIEDENYKVLLDVLLEKKTEEDKSVEPKKNEALLKRGAKGVKSYEKETRLQQEPPETERPLKRLRNQKERAPASVACSNPRLEKTSLRRAHQGVQNVVGSPSSSEGSQTSSELEDFEHQLKISRSRNGKEQPSFSAERDETEVFQTYFREVNESTHLYVGNEKTKLEPVSSPQRLSNEGRRLKSSQSCPVGETEPDQLDLYNNRATSNSSSSLNKGKALVITQAATEEARLYSEKGNEMSSKKPKVEPSMDFTPTENVLDFYHNDLLHMDIDERPFNEDELNNEGPLAVIHPAPPRLLCGDGSSISDSSDIKADDMEFLESKSSNREDKGDCVADSLQFDIASSSLGEVKISLICNSSRCSDFDVPSLDEVLKKVEESYKIMEPSFSLVKLMKEFCECFLAMGTHSTDNENVRSTNVPQIHMSKKSNALDIIGGKGNSQGFFCSPSLSNGLVKFQNCIVMVPQITKHITSGGFSGLQSVIGFKIKDIESICGESVLKMKALTGPQHSKSSSMETVQNCPPLHVLKPCSYIDDITRGEERLKISLINGSSTKNSPSFFYIPENIVYNKAYVSFSLARISDEDCCSQCSNDCLSSARPCACAQQNGGEFAYTPGGLVKKRFLEERIAVNQGPEKCHYFYCKDCPLERSKNKIESNSCKGHLMRKFIKECWSKCGCSKKCGNRVVQQGISANLQVFLTPEGKGWGLRTIEDLPKGAFVCEYVGEIVTNSELHERDMLSLKNEKHAYPVLLDADWVTEGFLKDEEALCLDATVYGNVARFINHRCTDATLVEIPVEVETPNHHYYHLALFTTRKVAAMEELTWDYGIDFDDHDHPVKPFKCLCGSPSCRDKNG